MTFSVEKACCIWKHVCSLECGIKQLALSRVFMKERVRRKTKDRNAGYAS